MQVALKYVVICEFVVNVCIFLYLFFFYAKLQNVTFTWDSCRIYVQLTYVNISFYVELA